MHIISFTTGWYNRALSIQTYNKNSALVHRKTSVCTMCHTKGNSQLNDDCCNNIQYIIK